MFGIERTTEIESGSSDSNVATVTPAATLTTTAPGVRESAISRSRSGTIPGLTATMTISAPSTARRFASGSSSVANAVTPGVRASSAARAAERLVTRTPPATETPGASRPERIARPMEPAPSIAMVGSVTFCVSVMRPS